jgi:hypothetical protein
MTSNGPSVVRLCLLEKSASVLPVPYHITVNWKMRVAGLMTRLRISNPNYFVEEEPKGTSECLCEFCGESAVGSRIKLRRTNPFREGRLRTACDARNSRSSREAK